ncbi:MAG: 1-(5-phosphoribosyl)-5-[(5-phosphoribosylamino)methylideneamino]imidazole-4-carboxamide isomerase [Crocinitomicaceae bacterium]|nr:1-(5-phosphoribosyl)-5-[(5-phosphoribosylamino)methylideneamino]imidazole-4-carboxamide isomerase [Crocinitomicaceae bacterium]
MKLIPAIDIIGGKCVRLTKGDYGTKKIYNENPLEVAKSFEDNGISYLHLVDLDGARSNRIINYKVLEKLAIKTNLCIDFGGGIKSDEDIAIAFDSGASKITAGSVAVQKRALVEDWIRRFGAEKIILGADCKERMIATNGWLKSSEMDVIEFINSYNKTGISEVICTDISKDGMLQGPATELYREIQDKTDIDLIASGGVSSMDDLYLLIELGCSGAIIGKAIYEGKITLKQLRELC